MVSDHGFDPGKLTANDDQNRSCEVRYCSWNTES